MDDFFPALPRGLKGRATELATLTRTIDATAPTRLALVGAGGSGKSVLAAALGRRLTRRFGGRIHWFRVGAWDFLTLTELLALRFGVTRSVSSLRAFLAKGERLLVLDNHEDDRAMARLLDALAGTPATFVITARRCLLSGVIVFPVTAPLVTAGRSAFPQVARLTRFLRWNPLALDLADAIVGTRAATVAELESYLWDGGVTRVMAVAHEDDLPEVALLVAWCWRRLGAPSRRLLGVLAHLEGDSADVAALDRLARLRGRAAAALAPLVRWRLIQEPMPGRYAVHAVIRHAVAPRAQLDQRRVFDYYVGLLERSPERLRWEQTHLFSAMDYAHRVGDLRATLRIGRLLDQLVP